MTNSLQQNSGRTVLLVGIKGDELFGIARNYWSERRPRHRGHDDQNRFQDYRTLCSTNGQNLRGVRRFPNA